MPDIGKFAQGLRGFPTPNNAGGSAGYLLFRFLDKEYAQYLLGAAKALEYAYNWYESGELSVDEAAELFTLINTDAPYEKLPTCSLPSGEELMRIEPDTGHIQNVDADGNWQNNPDIPSTPERPHASPEEERCLAAANTANALKILYENLSDSFSSGLSTAEAATALEVAIGETIAAAFFPPAVALVGAAGLIMGVIYAVVAFVSADVWTDDFTAVLQCYLFECASADADVVTYDFQCILDKLAGQTNVFDLTFTQLRLFGQLYYLLQMIGVDGLNYSGSATAITDATCDCGWCVAYSEVDGWGDWEIRNSGAVFDGANWSSVQLSGNTVCSIKLLLADAIAIESVEVHFVAGAGGRGGAFRGVYFNDAATVPSDAATNLCPDPGDNTCTVTYSYTTDYIGMNVDSAGIDGTNTINRIVLRGHTGSPPPGGSPC